MNGINLFDHGQAIYFSKSLIRVEKGAREYDTRIIATLWIKSVTITNKIPDNAGNITETIYVHQRINFDPSPFYTASTRKKRGSYPTDIIVAIAPEDQYYNKDRIIDYIEGQPMNENNSINISLSERFGSDSDVMLFGTPPTLSNGGFYSLEISEKISFPDWNTTHDKGLRQYTRLIACDYRPSFNYDFHNPAIFFHTRKKADIDVNFLGNGSLSNPGSGPIKLAHLAIWRVKRNPSTTLPVTKFKTGIVVDLKSSSIDPKFAGDTVEHDEAEAFAEVFYWNYDGEIK